MLRAEGINDIIYNDFYLILKFLYKVIKYSPAKLSIKISSSSSSMINNHQNHQYYKIKTMKITPRKSHVHFLNFNLKLRQISNPKRTAYVGSRFRKTKRNNFPFQKYPNLAVFLRKRRSKYIPNTLKHDKR